MVNILKLPFLLVRWLIIIAWWQEQLLKNTILKTRYKLTGQCAQCAKCCELIGVYDPDNYFQNKLMARLIILYYHKVNDFKFEGYEPNKKYFVFSCNNYDASQKRCLTYRQRPALCRSYPTVRYFDKPEVMADCGFGVAISAS